MAPQVTVVMAARNAESTILEAIGSIVAQRFADWELIVVDDASTDRTRALAESVADPRVRVRSTGTPSGAARARNLAMAVAQAPLIAIADADDISLPDRLGRQVQAFDADPHLAVLGAQLTEFGDWGERTGAGVFPTQAEEIERRFARGKMAIAHPAAVFKRDPALAVGGYDESLLRSEDLALFLRMRPALMRALPDHLVRYRVSARVSLRYVWREVHYAGLAHDRALSRPTPTTRFLHTALVALRSWTLRRGRELLASQRRA